MLDVLKKALEALGARVDVVEERIQYHFPGCAGIDVIHKTKEGAWHIQHVTDLDVFMCNSEVCHKQLDPGRFKELQDRTPTHKSHIGKCGGCPLCWHMCMS